jgi:hypothetical protein
MIFASATTSVSASTAGNTTTTTISSGIELSPQPIYQRQPSTSGVTPINQTHIGSTFSANGTLTLPNTTETINTTSNGSSLTSLTTQSAIGRRWDYNRHILWDSWISSFCGWSQRHFNSSASYKLNRQTCTIEWHDSSRNRLPVSN